ncbi:sentrin-specific protease 6-like isoform X2 [Actinia tenebrosa]|uniref:Sentrin-specific protease 6-like isoform X2 n=1 Tax=Actinia tenebrosa TaxID=6105 RepID=A0A6P8IR63_ACTTE|nr:sentrin-specific protease 6-like isoform X2 [Actinia tenebrosa]
MLRALQEAEKSPDKGFKGLPKFGESEEMSDIEEEEGKEREEEKEEDEVVLLEDTSDNNSKQGGTKVCLSSQVKEAHEYACRDFKIPKKSSQNDGHSNLKSSSMSQKKEDSFTSKFNCKTTKSHWDLESSFGEQLKTMMTRNSNLKNKSGKLRNIRQMVQRQDGIQNVSARRKSGNTSCLPLHKEASVTDKNKRINDGPFSEEINQIMHRDKQSIGHKNVEETNLTNSPQERDFPPSKLISFPSAAATPRNSIHEHSTSEDEKDKSNSKSFYGSERRPKVVKTYGNKKSCTIMNEIRQRTENNRKISVSTSDVDESESPVKNTKKRKITNKKNIKKNEKNENSNIGKQRKKHKAEPDFLLISSSDEEDNRSGLGDGNISGTESTMPKTKPESDSTPVKPVAENSITTVKKQSSGVCKTTGAVDDPYERDSFTTEIMLGPKVMIGKLKGSANGALEITAQQLKWKMECLDNNNRPVEKVVLILADYINSFKIHVDDPKIIVLEVNQCCALKLQGKFSGFGKFFDPCSAVVEETYIVLQVDDVLSAETLADITEWVQDRLCKEFKELSDEETEKLSKWLNSSSNSTSKSVAAKQNSHYNTRSSAIKLTARTTVTPTKMIIYPFPPTPGGITVTSADVECLAEGEFLNDVIIDFYLKYIYHGILSDGDKNRTHIFSSFFYKRLTQKSNNEFFQSPQDRMHSQVKKWTRNVDIFSKDFIIVPINESSHWFLAIFCFPNLVEPIIEESSSQEQPEVDVIEDSEDFKKEKAKVKVSVDEKSETADDDEDDADFETSALAVGAKKGTPSKKPVKKIKPVLKANPCILIFDSLANTGRSRVFMNLRNYLSREWKAKRPDKLDRDFTQQSFKGAFPKVPEQDNHCDCGIFVLQYVESFFEDPIQDYRLPIHKTSWFTHNGISGKRQEIKDLILRLKEKFKSPSS